MAAERASARKPPADATALRTGESAEVAEPVTKNAFALSLLAPVLGAMRGLGGLAIVLTRTVRAIPRLNPKEVLRSTVSFGFDSIALTLAVGVFIGFLLVLFSNLLVSRFGVKSLFGWASGYAVLRELGPFVTALVMTGRIGARNAAELGAMKTGGQIEGLLGVGVDPFSLLVAPRVLASAIAVTALGAVACLTAIISSIGFGIIVSQIDLSTFMLSFRGRVHPADLCAALVKLTAFGTLISLISTQVGLSVQGGAKEVGDAAARAVVSAAAFITVMDWGITFITEQVLP